MRRGGSIQVPDGQPVHDRSSEACSVPVRRAQHAVQALIQGLQQLLTIQFAAGMGELKSVRAQCGIHLLRRATGSVGKPAQVDTVIVIDQQTVEIQQ